MPFLDTISRELPEELVSAAARFDGCSLHLRCVGVQKEQTGKVRHHGVKKGSPGLPALTWKLMWACCCPCGNAGGREEVCMLPDHFCGKEGAFSRDAQIPWLLSVSPSYRQLCGMKAMGSRLGAVVLSNSLTEGLLIFVRRSWPKACSFLQTHPKEPLASDSKSGLEL